MIGVLFVYNPLVYSGSLEKHSIRVPSFPQDDDRERKARALMHYLLDRNNIIVYRNNVLGEPKGQVLMRVCEISELSDKERSLVIEGLESWGEGYTSNAVHVEYPGVINDISKGLTNPGFLEHNKRVYIAFTE